MSNKRRGDAEQDELSYAVVVTTTSQHSSGNTAPTSLSLNEIRIVINAVVSVSTDDAIYLTRTAAIRAAVNKVNAAHEFTINDKTIRTVIAQAKKRIHDLDGARHRYDMKLAEYEEKIAEMTQTAKRAGTRKHSAAIAEAESEITAPKPPPQMPLDDAYRQVVHADEVIRSRTGHPQRAESLTAAANNQQPQRSTTPLQAITTNEDESDIVVAEAKTAGKKRVRQSRGQYHTMRQNEAKEVNDSIGKYNAEFSAAMSKIAEAQMIQALAQQKHADAADVIAQYLKKNKENRSPN